MDNFYRALDEFEFEDDRGRRVRCSPGGSPIATDRAGDWEARIGKPIWDIRVEGGPNGQIDAETDETQESVRVAAIKLIEELEG